MIVFHDYDPAHPFAVTAEKHIIQDGKITLDYAPLEDSVSIEGFAEDKTGGLPIGTFFVNYGAGDNYRTADQIVHFPDGCDGLAVAVNYQGVSTLLRAKHLNEIRNFMERGASELAARIIAEHEQNMMDAIAEHCGHIVSAMNEIKEAIAAKGGAGGEYAGLRFASDEEADEMLDEFFPGNVEEVGYPSVFASDKEVESVLDEYLPLSENETPGGGTVVDGNNAVDDEL